MMWCKLHFQKCNYIKYLLDTKNITIKNITITVMISQEPPHKSQKIAAVLACVSSYFLQMQCLIILVSLSDCIAMLRSEKKSDASQKRTWKQRMKWSEFQGRLTDRQFRRMFRMSRECFLSLCQKLSLIGERKTSKVKHSWTYWRVKDGQP